MKKEYCENCGCAKFLHNQLGLCVGCPKECQEFRKTQKQEEGDIIEKR